MNDNYWNDAAPALLRARRRLRFEPVPESHRSRTVQPACGSDGG
jgi:hypothetical protein